MMGDIADYYLDSADPYEDWDEDITCKFCGETGLHWEEARGSWRLCDDEREHVCLRRVCSPSDFDEVDNG